VGRKTANVVLNTAFGEAAMAVDTHHLPRVQPHGPGAGKDVREVEDTLMRVVPAEFLHDATTG
jgi:endonuclease-3